MPKHTTGKLDAPTATESGPTPERLRQGRVEQLDRPIADAAGHPGRPYRTADTLMVMERRGSISAGMRQAGEDFRARFAVAQLDPLRALDLSHLRIAEPGGAPTMTDPARALKRPAAWYGARSRRSAASPRRPGRVCGMCSAGSARSR